MPNGQHVVITKHWDNPTINIFVAGYSDDPLLPHIQIAMDMRDYLAALSEEYGNPTSTLTKAQHLARLRAASEVVTTKLKLETSKVVG